MSAELDDNPAPTGTVDDSAPSSPSRCDTAIGERRDGTGDESTPPGFDRHRRGGADGREIDRSLELRRSDPDATAVGGPVGDDTVTVDREREDESVVVVGVVAHEVHASRRAQEPHRLRIAAERGGEVVEPIGHGRIRAPVVARSRSSRARRATPSPVRQADRTGPADHAARLRVGAAYVALLSL